MIIYIMNQGSHVNTPPTTGKNVSLSHSKEIHTQVNSVKLKDLRKTIKMLQFDRGSSGYSDLICHFKLL